MKTSPRKSPAGWNTALPVLVMVLGASPSCRNDEEMTEVLETTPDRMDCSRANADPTATFSYYKLRDRYAESPQDFADKKTFLGMFPESFRRRFVLFHNTESLDEASYAAPRIVFFDDPNNPRFMMGTDGTDGQHKKLEIIQFNPDRRRFCFHEIVLKEDAPPQFNDHPSNCVGCHKRDARPNWEAFNAWPRLFGSRDGAMAVGSAEERGYRQFLSLSSGVGVYSMLAGAFANTPTAGPGLVRVVNGGGADIASPHARLTAGMVRLNNQRISRILEGLVARSSHSRYKHALVGALLGCPDIDQFVPEPLRANHPHSFADILAQTRTAVRDAAAELNAQVARDNFPQDDRVPKGHFDLSFAPYLTAIANLRYLLENRDTGSISMADWSMSRLEAYHFAADGVGITDVGAQFYRNVFGSTQDPLGDPKLFDRKSGSYTEAQITAICNATKTLSAQQ